MLAFLSVANVWGTLTTDSIVTTATTSSTFVNGGKYVIGASYSSTMYYLAASTSNGKWGTGVTIGSAYIFTVHGSASGFYTTCSGGTLKTATKGNWGGYDNGSTNNIKIDGSGNIIVSSSTKPILKYNYNSGSGGFRWYDSGQQAAYLYQVGYNVFFTQPTTGGSISGTSTVATYDNTNKLMAGVYKTKTVTLVATPPSGKVVDAWTVKKKSDNTDVTSTVLSGTTLTMPAYDVVVSVTWKNSAACSNQITLTKAVSGNGSFF